MNVATSRMDWVERLAVGASAACLVHCLALPFLLAALPVLPAALSLPEGFHVWALAVALPSAAFALLHGRSRHGRSWPVLVGLLGLLFLLIGGFLTEGGSEIAVTVAGSTTLMIAHVANWRMRHACC